MEYYQMKFKDQQLWGHYSIFILHLDFLEYTFFLSPVLRSGHSPATSTMQPSATTPIVRVLMNKMISPVGHTSEEGVLDTQMD